MGYCVNLKMMSFKKEHTKVTRINDETGLNESENGR